MIYLLFEHLLVLPSLRQLYQWGKPMGWLFFPYSFRAGYSGSQCWEELSTGEKRRVGQRQSDPDWASNELQCDTRQGGRGAGSELESLSPSASHPICKLAALAYCPTALSFLGYVALKMKDDIEHLPMERSGTSLPVDQTARQQRDQRQDLTHCQTHFFSHQM